MEANFSGSVVQQINVQFELDYLKAKLLANRCQEILIKMGGSLEGSPNRLGKTFPNENIIY